MTMEQQQPILNSSERDEPFPTETTDTNPNITRGDNTLSEREVPHETMPESLTEASLIELRALDSWLLFKVKGALVAQIYSSIETDEPGIDISVVKDTILSELTSEKKKNLDQAERISEIIPRLAMHGLAANGMYDYTYKDMDNLQKRIEINDQVVEYIEAVEGAGEDGLYGLTESYIKEVQLDAQNEVLDIFKQRKAELEERNTSNEEKIVELQGVIGALKGEIKFTKDQLEDRDEQLADRDMQLLNSELVQHLTQEAQDIAR